MIYFEGRCTAQENLSLPDKYSKIVFQVLLFALQILRHRPLGALQRPQTGWKSSGSLLAFANGRRRKGRGESGNPEVSSLGLKLWCGLSSAHSPKVAAAVTFVLC